MYKSKNAIALLITVFFIMAITISIGIGLKHVNEASNEVNSEKLMLQSTLLVEDVLSILNKKSQEYNATDDTTGELFYTIFDEFSFPLVPIGDTDLKVGIELSSARSKFKINSIFENNTSKELLQEYLMSKMVDIQYIDMLEDVMGGIRVDQDYKTEIFYEKRHLFKDKNNYLTSLKNLTEINDFYKKTYHNNKIDIIDFQGIMSFSNSNNYELDLNCASDGVLEILGLSQTDKVDDEKQEISSCSIELCNSFSDEEKNEFASKYNATCTTQKYIDVALKIQQNNQTSTVRFEYDMNQKKGSNFSYDI